MKDKTDLEQLLAKNVMVPRTEYATLCQASDPHGGARYVLALKELQLSAIQAMDQAFQERDAAIAELEERKHQKDGPHPWSQEIIDAVDALEEKYDISLVGAGFANNHNRWREEAEKQVLSLQKEIESLKKRAELAEAHNILIENLKTRVPELAAQIADICSNDRSSLTWNRVQKEVLYEIKTLGLGE